MALLDWTQQQKQQFLQMQFDAQHRFYHEQFTTAQFAIIEHNNDAIGRLYVDRRPAEIRIIDIALLPGFRGKGIGGELMQALIDEGAACDKAVTIHVEHNNPAMQLYQRLGFKHVSDEGIYYFMKWQANDNPSKADQENTAS